MKKTIIYNFDTFWHKGTDFIEVNIPHFEYSIEDNGNLSEEELYKKYYDTALELAAYNIICEETDEFLVYNDEFLY